MIIVEIFLPLIFLLMVAMCVGAYLAWQKISIYLTWNTRYTNNEYEKAVMDAGKSNHHKDLGPPLPARKVESKGRSVVDAEEMIDFADMDMEEGYKVLENLGEGKNGA